MPLYEYYCRTCETKFELLRPMSRADEEATCPADHPGAQRVLSLFAAVRAGGDGEPMPIDGAGGGCACGGQCACGGH